VDDGILFQQLVGVSFYQDAIGRCAPAQAVKIIHEPDNPHDEMALRVESIRAETIGYLPRRSAIHVAVHQDGRGVSAVIDSIGMGRSCLLGVRLSVALCDDIVPIRSHYPDAPPPVPPPGGYRYWVRSPAGGAPRGASQKQPALPTPVRRLEYHRHSGFSE